MLLHDRALYQHNITIRCSQLSNQHHFSTDYGKRLRADHAIGLQFFIRLLVEVIPAKQHDLQHRSTIMQHEGSGRSNCGSGIGGPRSYFMHDESMGRGEDHLAMAGGMAREHALPCYYAALAMFGPRAGLTATKFSDNYPSDEEPICLQWPYHEPRSS